MALSTVIVHAGQVGAATVALSTVIVYVGQSGAAAVALSTVIVHVGQVVAKSLGTVIVHAGNWSAGSSKHCYCACRSIGIGCCSSNLANE